MTALAQAGYFDLAYYSRLTAIVRGWLELEEIDPSLLPEPEDADACRRLLFQEARYIDQHRLEEWLGLFTEDAAYWIAADVTGRDPARTISWEFNDRRRMEERVDRILTGKAYSQLPPTRTVHSYSNIELISAGPDEIHVLCTFEIRTLFAGEYGLKAGWNGFILRREDDQWRIVLKRINLFDADKPQTNLSFTL